MNSIKSPYSDHRNRRVAGSQSQRGLPKMSSLSGDQRILTQDISEIGLFDISVDDGPVVLDDCQRSIRFASAAAKLDVLFSPSTRTSDTICSFTNSNEITTTSTTTPTSTSTTTPTSTSTSTSTSTTTSERTTEAQLRASTEIKVKTVSQEFGSLSPPRIQIEIRSSSQSVQDLIAFFEEGHEKSRPLTAEASSVAVDTAMRNNVEKAIAGKNPPLSNPFASDEFRKLGGANCTPQLHLRPVCKASGAHSAQPANAKPAPLRMEKSPVDFSTDAKTFASPSSVRAFAEKAGVKSGGVNGMPNKNTTPGKTEQSSAKQSSGKRDAALTRPLFKAGSMPTTVHNAHEASIVDGIEAVHGAQSATSINGGRRQVWSGIKRFFVGLAPFKRRRGRQEDGEEEEAGKGKKEFFLFRGRRRKRGQARGSKKHRQAGQDGSASPRGILAALHVFGKSLSTSGNTAG